MKARLVLPLLFLGASSHTSMVMAQSSGTFTTTGNMITPRFLHTATLLADGRVLIAGGDMIQARAGNPVSFKTQSSAELYDPRSGTFTATGNMTTPRSEHTATLLPDGRVLITGGGVTNAAQGAFGDPALASAELYNPDTGTFSAIGDMSTARFGSTATLLSNGKVLIAGGFQRPEGGLSSAELYDPSTGKFTVTGNMINPWADTATLLPNGKVLITRGNPEGPPPFLSSADLYDPSTGTFSSAGYTTVNHTGPTATLLLNGKVLIAGGDYGDGDGPSVLAELFDPITATFTATGRLNTGREQHTANLLSDGTVLFAGGHTSLANSAEIYDPVKEAFNSTASMSTARELHTVTLLNDGRVLIAGGDDERYWIPETILSTAELYTPSVLVPAPVLLSLSGDGKGQGAIQHANTVRIASATDPAVAGEYLSIYLTGLADGSVIPPQVAIGGRLAEVTFFGNVPGYSGLNVINVRMPSGVTPGPAVPVRLTYLGRPSNGVTIGVSSSIGVNSSTIVTGVRNAASYVPGAIAPGELVAITGIGLGPAQLVSAAPGSDGLYATQLAGTTVQINGTPASLIYTWGTAVVALVPDSVSGDTAQVTVTYQGRISSSFSVPVAPTAPGIFTQDATGQGHAATINQKGAINIPAHWEGDVMTLFLTGAGNAKPAAIYNGELLPITQGPVPGVMQIKVPIERGTDCDLPVVFHVGNATTQPGVTIALDLCI